MVPVTKPSKSSLQRGALLALTEASSLEHIGIVTVLYLSDNVLAGFFASLGGEMTFGTTFTLYVIDNSPTRSGLDTAQALAHEHGIKAVFVFNNANLGVAKGNNQGIELALDDGCSHILLANNDVEFRQGTIDTLLSALTSGERIATPKILYYGADSLIWYAGGDIRPWTMRVPHFGMLTRDRGQYDQAGHTPYAPTCFMLLEASVFREVGLMDEAYFVYYDDADFVWRMNKHGLRIRYTPQSVVQHKVSTSTGGSLSPFTLYYTNRNRIYFIRKNLDGPQRAFALTYSTLTRVIRIFTLPKPLAAKVWAGLKDGWRMNVANAPH
jgi:GT2 family glycosyltransferase